MSLHVVRKLGFVSCVVMIFSGGPIFANAGPDELRKQFFIENYVDTVTSDPNLFIKHMAYFNYAILSESPNTPEAMSWNRAGRLFERMELDRGISEFFKNGSTLGIGLDVPLLPGVSVDLTKAAAALGGAFIGYGSISEEQIKKEAVAMVADKPTVRAVAETIYDAYFNGAQYAPMNSLGILVEDLAFKPDSPPGTYIELMSNSDRARLNLTLAELPHDEAEDIRNNFEPFSDLMWSTFWGSSSPVSPLDSADIDSLLQVQSGKDSLDYNSFGVSLIASDFGSQRQSFSDWWRDSFEDTSKRNDQGISEMERASASLKVAEGNTREFRKMMGYLRSISRSQGGDTKSLDIIEGFGSIVTAVEELRSIQGAAEAGVEISALQAANGYLAVFSAGVGLLSTLADGLNAKPDVELERFMALYNNQIKILEGVNLIDRRIRYLSLALIGVEEKIVASEDRIRDDLAKISRMIEGIQSSSAETYDFLIATEQQEAVTPLLLEWRNVRRKLLSGPRGEQLSLSSAEDFLIRRVANPPFISVYPASYLEITSMRPQGNSVGLFIPVANIVMAATRYRLVVGKNWNGTTEAQGDALSKELVDFLNIYSLTGPRSSKDTFYHNESAFAAALLHVVDLAAINGPSKGNQFPIAEVRDLHNRNQQFWRNMVRGVPALSYSIQQDTASLSSEMRPIQREALELLTGHEVSEMTLDFIREFGLNSFPLLYSCMKEGAGTDGAATDNPCTKFGAYVLWGGDVTYDGMVNLLRDLNMLETQRIYGLVFFAPSGEGTNYCAANCFNECADVASGFAWSDNLYNRYFSELGSPDALIDGYLDSVRTICQSFPQPDGPKMSAETIRDIYDIGGSCFKNQESCNRRMIQFFEEKIWPVYFVPRLKGIFMASPEVLTEFAISSRSGKVDRKYPPQKKVSSAPPTDKGYDAVIDHNKNLLDRMFHSEILRISDGFYSHLAESRTVNERIESIDNAIWSIAYIFPHISPACQDVLRRHLLFNQVSLSDAADVGFQKKFRSMLASKNISELSLFLDSTQSAAQGIVASYLSSHAENECYLASDVSLDIDHSLEFIARLLKN